MDHRHPGFIGELPEIFRRAPDADLDGAGRIEDAIQNRVAHGPAVMELRLVERAARVAMGVDMDEADGLLGADRLEDRMGYGMVATDGERNDTCFDDLADCCLDILMALLQPIATGEWDVTDIGYTQIVGRSAVEHMIIWSDALDAAHGPRSKSRARPIGDAEIHGDADSRDL